MKKLLLVVAVAVGGKFAFDHFATERTNRNMDRVVAELNQGLPQTNGAVRFEKVVYEGQVIRFSGTLLAGQDLSPDFTRALENQLRTEFCGRNNALRKANVGVEYAFTRTGIKSISDKVRDPETWSVTLRPENCT